MNGILAFFAWETALGSVTDPMPTRAPVLAATPRAMSSASGAVMDTWMVCKPPSTPATAARKAVSESSVRTMPTIPLGNGSSRITTGQPSCHERLDLIQVKFPPQTPYRRQDALRTGFPATPGGLPLQ